MTTDVKRKRHRLTKMVYDEVSLVDAGANQHAHVVIAKADRQRSSGSSSRGLGSMPSRKAGYYSADGEANLAPKNITAAQRKTLEDAEVKRRKGDRDKKRKESERAQNWQEERHKRKAAGSPAGGEFDTTSSESKRKYGRGGTTQEKLDRLERRKKHLLDRKSREDAAEKEKGGGTEKVKAGDTLWQMAVNHYGDGNKWKLIAAANGITDPKKLKIGAVLEIPTMGRKKGSSSSSDDDDSSSGTNSRRRKSSTSSSGEGETREERLKDLQAQRKELLALLEDLDDEVSTRKGDIQTSAGVTVRPDGTVVFKNRRRS